MVVNYPNARVVFNHKYHGDRGRTILYPTSVPDWSAPVTTDIYIIIMIATENCNSPRPYDGMSSF